MANLNLVIELPIADCETTGLKKKLILENVHISAAGAVTISGKEVWLGLNGEEVKVVTAEGFRQNPSLTEDADVDGDYPESAKFKVAVEASLKTLMEFLVIQKQLI